MSYIERILLSFLQSSKIEMEINGFDMEGFEKIVNQELKCRLEMIEYIVFSDDDIVSDAKKVESIKQLFQREFYDEE